MQLDITRRVNMCALQELAWSSYSLLRNTNTCSVLVAKAGAVVMVRGGFTPLSGGGPTSLLEAFSKVNKLPLQGLNLTVLRLHHMRYVHCNHGSLWTFCASLAPVDVQSQCAL